MVPQGNNYVNVILICYTGWVRGLLKNADNKTDPPMVRTCRYGLAGTLSLENVLGFMVITLYRYKGKVLN
jgi:hypothetical protein